MGSLGITVKTTTTQSTMDQVVARLVEKFPDQTHEPESSTYQAFQNSYWSGILKEARPRCFFHPRTAKDVAEAVQLCVEAQCIFGVKSGGHTHCAGWSSVDGGIQIDLSALDDIAINKSNSTVTVGSGCRWRALYEKCEEEGLLPVGGRSADVGVGGFLVGGGISFYAASRGWGIDNVRSFEVVLSTGAIVLASRDSEPALFKALRGGGSNFGIITSYELETVPYKGMWGGRTLIDQKDATKAISAYADFVPKLRADPKGHSIIIFDYVHRHCDVRQYIVYTEPIADLPMFQNLLDVPTVKSSIGMTSYSALADDIANLQDGGGLRHAVSTITIELDFDLLEFIYQTYLEDGLSIQDFGGGCLEFHAIPRLPLQGENVYGLETHRGNPLIAVMLAFGTPFPEHDSTLLALQKSILARIKAEAERRGLYHPFLFANYAGPFQEIASSYGPKSSKYLSEVADQYDPDRIFQRLKPGGYKLNESTKHGRL